MAVGVSEVVSAPSAALVAGGEIRRVACGLGMQQLAEVFPLTHVTAAARAIMIDGAGLLDVSYHLVVLTVQSIIFLFIGAYFFRWE